MWFHHLWPFQKHDGFFILFLSVSWTHQRALCELTCGHPHCMGGVVLLWFLNVLNNEFLCCHPQALSGTIPLDHGLTSLETHADTSALFKPHFCQRDGPLVQELLKFLFSWKFVPKALCAQPSLGQLQKLPTGFTWTGLQAPTDTLQYIQMHWGLNRYLLLLLLHYYNWFGHWDINSGDSSSENCVKKEFCFQRNTVMGTGG